MTYSRSALTTFANTTSAIASTSVEDLFDSLQHKFGPNRDNVIYELLRRNTPTADASLATWLELQAKKNALPSLSENLNIASEIKCKLATTNISTKLRLLLFCTLEQSSPNFINDMFVCGMWSKELWPLCMAIIFARLTDDGKKDVVAAIERNLSTFNNRDADEALTQYISSAYLEIEKVDPLFISTLIKKLYDRINGTQASNMQASPENQAAALRVLCSLTMHLSTDQLRNIISLASHHLHYKETEELRLFYYQSLILLTPYMDSKTARESCFAIFKRYEDHRFIAPKLIKYLHNLVVAMIKQLNHEDFMSTLKHFSKLFIEMSTRDRDAFFWIFSAFAINLKQAEGANYIYKILHPMSKYSFRCHNIIIAFWPHLDTTGKAYVLDDIKNRTHNMIDSDPETAVYNAVAILNGILPLEETKPDTASRIRTCIQNAMNTAVERFNNNPSKRWVELMAANVLTLDYPAVRSVVHHTQLNLLDVAKAEECDFFQFNSNVDAIYKQLVTCSTIENIPDVLKLISEMLISNEPHSTRITINLIFDLAVKFQDSNVISKFWSRLQTRLDDSNCQSKIKRIILEKLCNVATMLDDVKFTFILNTLSTSLKSKMSFPQFSLLDYSVINLIASLLPEAAKRGISIDLSMLNKMAEVDNGCPYLSSSFPNFPLLIAHLTNLGDEGLASAVKSVKTNLHKSPPDAEVCAAIKIIWSKNISDTDRESIMHLLLHRNSKEHIYSTLAWIRSQPGVQHSERIAQNQESYVSFHSPLSGVEYVALRHLRVADKEALEIGRNCSSSCYYN